jgi:hypothetical protein
MLALKRPQTKQASRTAEGSRPYLPQLGHSFRNRVSSYCTIWVEQLALSSQIKQNISLLRCDHFFNASHKLRDIASLLDSLTFL